MQLNPDWIYPPAPHSVMFIFLLIMTISVFILSGMVLTVPLLIKNKLDYRYFMISSLLASCSLGYLAYWLFFINPILGKLFCLLMYFTILFLVIFLITRIYKKNISKKIIVTLKSFALVVIFATMVTGFYSSILYSCTNIGKISKKNQYCSIVDNTFDNTLPLSFAISTYKGSRQATVSDWSTADRPPLQSGIMLTQIPLFSKVGGTINGYQILMVFVQCLWIFVLFEYLKRASVKYKNAMYIMIIAVTSTFIFSNSIFVWPKMLAASLGLISFITLSDALKVNKLSSQQSVIISTAITLGMLAHGGLVFTVIPLLMYGSWKFRRYIKTKQIIIVCIVPLILYSPWLIYKTANSSGDRLINWWISGKVETDNRPVQIVLAESYSKISTREVIKKKADNIKTLFGFLDYNGPVSTRDSVGTLANLESSFFVPSFSFMLIGLLMIFRDYISKNIEFKKTLKKSDIQRIALLIGGVSLLFWVILSFGPPNAPTIAYAGSYATFLLLYFAFGAYLGGYNWIKYVALISTVYFIIINALLISKLVPTLNTSYIILALVFAIIGSATLGYIKELA